MFSGELSHMSCCVSEDGRKLILSCNDNSERQYHGVWLRHNCRCPQCSSTSSHQNVVGYKNLIDLTITFARIEGDAVNVQWSSQTGPHSCRFSIEWLKKYNYASPYLHEERRKEEEPLIADSLPEFDYNDAIVNDTAYYEWMRQINLYGMTLMKNIPGDINFVEFFKQIAKPQVHPFSQVSDILAKPDPTNVAYSVDELVLHEDMINLENTPGILILHCKRFDDCIEGGESSVVDAYPVIEELRRKRPYHFEVLSRVPFIAMNEQDSFDQNGVPGSFAHAAPHIMLDAGGKVIGFRWCPIQQYPLFATEKDTEDYYEAFTVLYSMLDNSSRKFTHRLKPGEALILNNRRVVHARNSFKTNGGVRHLQTFYLSIDFFRSRLIVLAKELKKTERIKHFLNTSYFA